MSRPYRNAFANDCVWTGSLYELASDALITPLHSYLDGQAGNDLQLLFTDAS